jgi:hypothetical protein
MKRKDVSIHKNFGPVALYYDDLSRIVGILESNGIDNLKFATDEYEFSSLEELEELDVEFLNNFEINSRGNGFWIHIGKYGTSIYSPKKTGEFYAAFTLVVEYLKKKRRKLRILYSPLFSGLTLGVFPVYLFENIKSMDAYKILIAFLLFLVGALTTYNALVLGIEKANLIFLKRKLENPGFFKRNKDSLILVIIGSIIGAIITKIIEFLK